MIFLSLGSTLKEMINGPTVRREKKKKKQNRSKLTNASQLLCKKYRMSCKWSLLKTPALLNREQLTPPCRRAWLTSSSTTHRPVTSPGLYTEEHRAIGLPARGAPRVLSQPAGLTGLLCFSFSWYWLSAAQAKLSCAT